MSGVRFSGAGHRVPVAVVTEVTHPPLDGTSAGATPPTPCTSARAG